ncbi:hypothetical protein [Nocardia sp. NBC_00511]|uniref:hypothetical protein n=1 Tax=Nocardia sp. NBC_00511 TaxID=2903591 RepID=UPI0030E0C066
MSSPAAPLGRTAVRWRPAALLAGIAIVLGLVAAVAGWGSAQRVSLSTASVTVLEAAAKGPIAQLATTPAPVCRQGEHPPAPVGDLAVPPRAIGDQLVTAAPLPEPEFTAAQLLSPGKQPRAPALPRTAPHLTTVLII